MRLLSQLTIATLFLSSLDLSAKPSPVTGFVIERSLGQGGGLGKETLLLECGALSRKSCEVRKTANGVALSGKIPYADANRIVSGLFKLEEKRPATSSAPSHPLIYWGASFQGKNLKGAFAEAQDQFDLAVLAAEFQISRGLKK
ncbi:MAG: hypothetical protein ACJ763_15630 [Bdellovibrionia bacterium]